MCKNRLAKILVGSSVLIILLNACGFEESELEKRRKADDEAISHYLAENDIEAMRDPSGLYYEVLRENPQGRDVKLDDVVSIYYDMKTLEGEEIESSEDSIAIRFAHDFQSIIPVGLDYAVQLMSKGEKFRFYVPSVLAYGDYGAPDHFDPNTIFIIEVEVVDIQDEDDVNELELDSIRHYISLLPQNEAEQVQSFPSGLFYQQLEEGMGRAPFDYSTVSFYYERRYMDSTLLEKTNTGYPVTLTLGRGYAVKGLEEGILRMKKGGRALLVMPSKIAFGASIQVVPSNVRDQLLEDGILLTKVQPYSPIVYEVELVDVQ